MKIEESQQTIVQMFEKWHKNVQHGKYHFKVQVGAHSIQQPNHLLNFYLFNYPNIV